MCRARTVPPRHGRRSSGTRRGAVRTYVCVPGARAAPRGAGSGGGPGHLVVRSCAAAVPRACVVVHRRSRHRGATPRAARGGRAAPTRNVVTCGVATLCARAQQRSCDLSRSPATTVTVASYNSSRCRAVAMARQFTGAYGSPLVSYKCARVPETLSYNCARVPESSRIEPSLASPHRFNLARLAACVSRAARKTVALATAYLPSSCSMMPCVHSRKSCLPDLRTEAVGERWGLHATVTASPAVSKT